MHVKITICQTERGVTEYARLARPPLHEWDRFCKSDESACLSSIGIWLSRSGPRNSSDIQLVRYPSEKRRDLRCSSDCPGNQSFRNSLATTPTCIPWRIALMRSFPSPALGLPILQTVTQQFTSKTKFSSRIVGMAGSCAAKFFVSRFVNSFRFINLVCFPRESLNRVLARLVTLNNANI